MKEKDVTRETQSRTAPGPERAEEWPREVRTTMEPNRPYRVDEAEYRDLKALGILKEGN